MPAIRTTVDSAERRPAVPGQLPTRSSQSFTGGLHDSSREARCRSNGDGHGHFRFVKPVVRLRRGRSTSGNADAAGRSQSKLSAMPLAWRDFRDNPFDARGFLR